jgi:hypothetical protein
MPRPGITDAFVSACQSPYVKPALFVEVHMLSGPVYVWSGVGSIGWAGKPWQGVGQFGMISSIEEGANVQARGIELSLSGFDPTLLSDIMTDYQQGLPALVYLGLFDPATNSLIPDPITCFSGRTDQPTITVSGETAGITIACETRLVEMNTTASFRRYTNEDQQIDFPGDLAFGSMNSIQAQTLYWGRLAGQQNLGVSTGN